MNFKMLLKKIEGFWIQFMNKMLNNKLILVVCMVLIFASTVIAASTVQEGNAGSSDSFVGSGAEDNDGDGVCNENRDYYRGRRSEYASKGIDIDNLGCTATSFGDLCPGTPVGENAYKLGDRSGCSESQLVGRSNYWSIRLGDMRPSNIKSNWLTDQRQGIKVYLPISFVKNNEFIADEEQINFRDASFTCDNGRGVVRLEDYELPNFDFENEEGSGSDSSTFTVGDRNGVAYVEGNYGSVSKYGSGSSVDLTIRLNYQSDESLIRPKGLTKDLKLDSYRDQAGIDEIEFICTARIDQCRERIVEGDEGREVSGCSGIYPSEEDEFLIIVPLDSLALQAPDAFLKRGISTADFIIDFSDSLIKPLDDAYKFTSGYCTKSITWVLFGKGLSLIFTPFNELANFIWFGPKGLQQVGLYNNAFIISGRSMCAAAVCPRKTNSQEEEWCKVLDWTPPGADKSLGELATDKDGRPIPIQNSLILSAGCGCSSGMLVNVYRLKAMALDWRACLLRAETSGEFVGQCDRYLKEGICEFVINEVDAWKGFSFGFIQKLFGDDKPKVETPEKATIEAGQALGWSGRAKKAVNEADNFYDEELRDIASATGGGVLGFGQHALARTYCSLAMYGQLPDFSKFGSLDLRKVNVESTTSSNFEYGIAYLGEGGKPEYEYKVRWMIVSGRENLGYRVYLENDVGATRPIYSGSLSEVGDFSSDYIEITDNLEYTKICFDLKQEANRIRCYPPGGQSEGGLLSDLDMFRRGEEVIDTDEDRLPDTWETKYSCDVTRTNFGDEKDRADCSELLYDDSENKLSPNNPDSDADGINDGSEDPDNDGLNNYQEYLNNGNPNLPLETIDGGVIQTTCKAEFDDFNIVGGESIDKIKSVSMKFSPTDIMKVSLIGTKVININKRDASEEDIIVRTEIKGPQLFNILDETSFNEASSNFIVWRIPGGRDAPSTGIYTIKVQLILPDGIVNYDLCRDDKGVLAEKTKKILFINPENIGCIDSDRGENYDLGGVCIDSTGVVYSDDCEGSKAVDYYCNSAKQCTKGMKDCGVNGNCISGEGKCMISCFDNDPGNDVGGYGVCKYYGTDKQWHILSDGCNPDQDVSFEYSCDLNNICVQEPKLCPIVEDRYTKCFEREVSINFADAKIIKEKMNVGACLRVDPDRPTIPIDVTIIDVPDDVSVIEDLTEKDLTALDDLLGLQKTNSDLNKDGSVNEQDYDVFKETFSRNLKDVDLNGDKIVDFKDFLIYTERLGKQLNMDVGFEDGCPKVLVPSSAELPFSSSENRDNYVFNDANFEWRGGEWFITIPRFELMPTTFPLAVKVIEVLNRRNLGLYSSPRGDFYPDVNSEIFEKAETLVGYRVEVTGPFSFFEYKKAIYYWRNSIWYVELVGEVLANDVIPLGDISSRSVSEEIQERALLIERCGAPRN
jgi:hypothetical protein